MPNPPLEQDWPAESRIVIAEDDIPEIPDDARPWEKPPAPPANTPASPMEKFHRLRTPEPLDELRETPDERRARTLADIDSDLSAAELGLANARAWARSIGYHAEVTELLEAAAELVSRAQGLVDAFEART